MHNKAFSTSMTAPFNPTHHKWAKRTFKGKPRLVNSAQIMWHTGPINTLSQAKSCIPLKLFYKVMPTHANRKLQTALPS